MPIERHIDEYGFETIRFVPSPEQVAAKAERERLEAEQAAAKAERKRLREQRAAWRQEQEERKAAGLEPSEPPPGLYAPRRQRQRQRQEGQQQQRQRGPRAPREDGVNAWYAMSLEWRQEHGRRWVEKRKEQREEQTAKLMAELDEISRRVFGRPLPKHPNARRVRQEPEQQEPPAT
jgi:hypothetical protein